MNLRKALKENLVVQVELDLYLLEDGRAVKYDRYIKGEYRWICDDGYAYRNFFELFNKCRYCAKQHNFKVA